MDLKQDAIRAGTFAKAEYTGFLGLLSRHPKEAALIAIGIGIVIGFAAGFIVANTL